MLGYYVFLAVLMIVANWPNIIPLFLRDYVVYETINLISSWYTDEFLLVACVLFRSSKTWKVKIEFEESMKKFRFQFYSDRNLLRRLYLNSKIQIRT